MNLSNDDKLMLAAILDRAEAEVRKDRENYLRSGDAEAQLSTIQYLTAKLQFIERMQLYCMQMEGVAP